MVVVVAMVVGVMLKEEKKEGKKGGRTQKEGRKDMMRGRERVSKNEGYDGWKEGRQERMVSNLPLVDGPIAMTPVATGRKDGRTEGRKEGRKDGRTEGRKDGWMDITEIGTRGQVEERKR